MSTYNTILLKLKQRYITLRIAELALLTLAVALIVWSVVTIFDLTTLTKITLVVVVAFGATTFRYFQLGLHKVTPYSISDFLNTHYAQLHASTDLLLENQGDLSTLRQLQRIKTQRDLEELQPQIQFPHQLKAVGVMTLLALIAFISLELSGFRWKYDASQSVTDHKTTSAATPKTFIPAEIKTIAIHIAPPLYTGLKKHTVKDLNLTVPENSQAQWALTFSNTVQSVALATSFQDTIRFIIRDNAWQASASLLKNGFYQLVWRDSTLHTSDFYKIEVILDQQPVIKINGLDQFTQVEYNSKQNIEVNSLVTDDYGLTDAYIIATVSKGSGESVKFREEKLLFTSPSTVQGKQLNLKRSIDLGKMGMEPGDELYFYVEALDNKTPLSNRARTETYFISLKDTAQDVMVSDGGLGVDLMPEYFRSQRQIIIDTEKLIREQKTTAKKDFNFKSNELGYDQKVLRLRYGQFMGEEFETGIGPAEHVAPDDDHDHEESHEKKVENLARSFGHQHDTENEHNLVDQKKSAAPASHSHKDENADPNKPVNVMDEFMHKHDNEESATFIFQSVKLKLKAALTQMWDAELYLRLNEPQKSLPYQYIALRLLKEISNDSRIYVHRTGFDPPPIKEEKRLSADLNEIFNATHTYDANAKKYFPQITNALRVTEQLIAKGNVTLSKKEKDVILQSGNELAAAALENPAILEGLTALQHVTSNDQKENIRTNLLLLRKAYWLALPKKPATATKSATSLHALDEQFIRQLQRLP